MEWLSRDPELVYPNLRGTLECSNGYFQFRIGETTYKLVYKEGQQESESDWWSGRRGRTDETITTLIKVAFEVDEKVVIDFKVRHSVIYGPDMPYFSDTMGEIAAFIEGPWVTVVGDLLQGLRLHEKTVRDKRQAPRLKEEMKRFGL